jgi:hypothetical protein
MVDSSILLKTAQFIAIVCAILSVSLFVLTLICFYLHKRGEKNEAIFKAATRPILANAMMGLSHDEIILKRNEIIFFLTLWNHLQESVRGEMEHRLNHIFYELNILHIVRRWLSSFNLEKKLVAIWSLGQLGDQYSFTQIKKIAQSSRSKLALSASRALLRINCEEGIAFLAPLIAERLDWAPSRLVSMLKEFSFARIQGPILKVFHEERELLKKERILKILFYTDKSCAAAEVSNLLLRNPQDPLIRLYKKFAPERNLEDMI